MKGEDKIFNFGSKVGTHISPVLTIVFLMGIFWYRANEKGMDIAFSLPSPFTSFTFTFRSFSLLGAIAGMVVGFLVGIIRLCLNLAYVQKCNELAPAYGTWYLVCGDFNNFAIFLAIITCIVRFTSLPFTYFTLQPSTTFDHSPSTFTYISSDNSHSVPPHRASQLLRNFEEYL